MTTASTTDTRTEHHTAPIEDVGKNYNGRFAAVRIDGERIELRVPKGTRGVAAMHRAGRFGTAADYLKRAEEEICVILQLETPEAIALIPEIAALEGLDCLFVGPGDLSASLGLIGEVGHPEVQRALESAAQACVRAGKPVGIVAPTPEMAKRFLGYGYSWSAVASDLGLLMGRAREVVAAMKAGA